VTLALNTALFDFTHILTTIDYNTFITKKGFSLVSIQHMNVDHRRNRIADDEL